MRGFITKRNQYFLTGIVLLFALVSHADDYFWIGGSGNWSDINHWANASGGSILHNTPPSADDDVYFDVNSFLAPSGTVTVNTENAVCKTLDWSAVTNNPTFVNSTSVNLKIFGSLILSANMQYGYNGTLTFESVDAGNSIVTSGHSILNNVIFDGIGGEWVLQDELNVAATIFLNYGTLNSNDQIINCMGFSSSTTNPRGLILGNSQVYIAGSWNINSVDLIFDFENSILNIGSNMTNSGSEVLIYNKVFFTGGWSSLQNLDAYVYYESISFQGSGSLQGNCSVNDLVFTGIGSVYDSDSIHYARFLTQDTIFNNIIGSHQIENLEILTRGKIEGQNHIHTATIGEQAKIIDQNQIDYIRIGDTAYIEGSNEFGYLFLNKMGYIRENNFAQNAIFNCDGSFLSNNTFDTLYFTPGFEYIFQHGSMQTINNKWYLDGTCEAPIFIKSSYNGLIATITATETFINGTHLSIRDMNASGNTPFMASQSVDLGNNTNWNIETMNARDLYWVNGQGDWDNSNHWDINSGGPGGHCPPTELDNAYFDGNSAGANDTININTRNAVCYNMDWNGTNNPVLFGPDTNNLKIYGSLKFDPAMVQSFYGETFFEDWLGGKTVFTAEKMFLDHVWFNGTNGEWTLLDIFQCTDTIYHERGSVSTDGSNIICRRYSSADTNHRKLYLHSDTVKLFGNMVVWDLNGTNYDLHADSSVIVTSQDGAEIKSENAERLVYHNIHQMGIGSKVSNNAYCVYNLVTHQGAFSEIVDDCTIDTSIMYDVGSRILGNDTIKTAIYYGANSLLDGSSIVEIAYFYESGITTGSNTIDTALFYNTGTILGSNQIDTTIIFDDATISGQNKIRTATLKDKGWFYGNNEFDELTFTYAKKYIFEHDSTQIIHENWNAIGRCTGNIFLMSDFDGKQAIIEKTNGNVEIEYANIRDINASGNTPFIANNSIDLGNNENWEITMGESIALFWVGGTGNWSDSLHWAPVSGGQGPYCIPSPIDDVYFDENSFLVQSDTVFIDIENATCRNMSWAGSEIFNPVFTGDSENNLFIYGSLLFNNSMEVDYSGITFFESLEQGRTIESKGQTLNNHAIFQGRTGGWSFIDDFSTIENIHLVYGNLNTNNQSLYCNNFFSIDTNQREILLNESELFVSKTWIINARNLVFDGDSSTINSGHLFRSLDSDTLVYNDVNMYGYPLEPITLIYNDSIYCRYNNIHFYDQSEGNIRGNCSIDTIIFESPAGIVYDSDSINYAWFRNMGSLSGGEHHVKSALFDGPGNISGACEVYSAIFNSSGNISGENTIDTTIIYGNGNIQGDNLFKSYVNIYGSGLIQGANVFNSSVVIYQQGAMNGDNLVVDNLVIHGHASIFGNNLINDALLMEWGDLGGTNIFDTLTFTPGNTYTLVNGQTQTINHQFNIRGNNCFPIILKSSSTGSQANIFMGSDTVSGDFISMKDIHATGDATFYAGGHSTDISNNSGWIWNNAPGYIYGLGLEHAYLCEGDELVLSTDNFNGNPDTQYQWGDGTISPTYTVTQPGVYSLTVIYSDDCEVPGEVIVEQLPAPEIDLGEDQEICEGLTIDFTPGEDYTSYLWNTGSTNATIPATETGNYWLEVTGENGCKNSDTIYLEVMPAPHVDIGEDLIIYNDEYVILDAGYTDGIHEWSTGETTQSIQAYGIEGGNEYWVVVEYLGCTGADTIIIDEYPICVAEIPTAFTPNNDGLNDVLNVLNSGLQTLDFKIYNRYGELVFETFEPTGQEGWNGTVQGTRQEIEVYTYYLKAICKDGFLIEKKGNITLIR
ncbi:MAG: gliding motility-associated C-terminal domain-containing protein [Bacteroidales bacterium]|nr:gliding motility-associated C-terminal domain-containing protein [Bacteroidales bacterium]